MKITNISAGPRGLNTKTGAVLVEAGQTADVELEAAEKAVAMKTGWFVEGDAPKTNTQASDDQAGEIARLNGVIAEKDALISDLQKRLPETDINKMGVAELRGFLAFHDVAYDGTKDKKDDLLTKAKTVKVA